MPTLDVQVNKVLSARARRAQDSGRNGNKRPNATTASMVSTKQPPELPAAKRRHKHDRRIARERDQSLKAVPPTPRTTVDGFHPDQSLVFLTYHDVVLRSSDDVKFYASRSKLNSESTFFANLDDMQLGAGEEVTAGNSLIIDLPSASSTALDYVLEIINDTSSSAAVCPVIWAQWADIMVIVDAYDFHDFRTHFNKTIVGNHRSSAPFYTLGFMLQLGMAQTPEFRAMRYHTLVTTFDTMPVGVTKYLRAEHKGIYRGLQRLHDNHQKYLPELKLALDKSTGHQHDFPDFSKSCKGYPPSGCDTFRAFKGDVNTARRSAAAAFLAHVTKFPEVFLSATSSSLLLNIAASFQNIITCPKCRTRLSQAFHTPTKRHMWALKLKD